MQKPANTAEDKARRASGSPLGGRTLLPIRLRRTRKCKSPALEWPHTITSRNPDGRDGRWPASAPPRYVVSQPGLHLQGGWVAWVTAITACSR